MKFNINALIFWIIVGLLAFVFGAGAKGIALAVACAMTVSLIVR